MLRRARIGLIFAVIAAVTPALVTAQTPVAPAADEICGVVMGTPVAQVATPASIDLAALDFDLILLDAMIPHHKVSISAASVLLDGSDDDVLREFTTALIDTRTVELAIMEGWRQEWYGDVPVLTEPQLVQAMNMKLSDSPGVGGVAGLEEMGAEHARADLADLCAADDDLDIVFMDMLVAHNASAIILNRESVDRAVHAELKQFSDAVVVNQQYEIDQLLTWRELWFPGTPIPDHHQEAGGFAQQ